MHSIGLHAQPKRTFAGIPTSSPNSDLPLQAGQSSQHDVSSCLETAMRRREFIGLLGSAVATWTLSVRAQQGEGVRRIGVLMARKTDDAEGQKQFAALRQGLAELGWSEGKAFHVETRWTAADAAEALKFAQELVASKPDVLVVNGTPSLIAMRQVTSTI